MFGHDDKDQNNDQGTPMLPVPDDLLTEDTATDAPVNNAQPADQTGAPTVSTDPVAAAAPADDLLTATPTDDLLNIKRNALQQLQPLVGHLDQTPEEKFKTTMMMIQAADDKRLVQTAYDAAQQITDEKARAQALLDVINEINYFTHPQDN